ncbi:hypothetical protein BT63DRAFT_425745 [Microthyrium microscopicum]|uniref:BAG domain-containing protein n=1 Tax=Microthyrium microscopicum TaxID=703497 RepID=A0A6A6U8D5_9PEZI|nr:hypothetical protein BT63DRAFT_425745 [Microthyrium microscopicum]
MSWSSRFGAWGSKISPFGRPSPNSGDAQVTDQDFSYITTDDIKRSEQEAKATRPPRDTDALCLKHKRISYPVHFPAYSIDDGELTIGKIREAAARRVELPVSEASRIKLFYKGKNLKEDSRTAKEEGMVSESQPEILLVLGDKITQPESESDEEEEEATAGGKKKRKSRKRKKKSRTSGTATPEASNTSSRSTPLPDATFAAYAAPPPRPTAAPAAPKAASSPIEKIDALASTFHTSFVPNCIKFLSSPPEDASKRDFDHKRLTETILAQILLKLDAVETEGDMDARTRRKELVKEVQGMLNQLDEVMKK